MTAKKTAAPSRARRAAAPPPPPPPAAETPLADGCAIEKLNSRLMAIGQARDALIGIETLEDLSGVRHGTEAELRERIQTRVREIARGIAEEWTAHER